MTNISHLTKAQLKVLYIDFTVYRDRDCNGWSRISVFDFFYTNREKYEAIK